MGVREGKESRRLSLWNLTARKLQSAEGDVSLGGKVGGSLLPRWAPLVGSL